MTRETLALSVDAALLRSLAVIAAERNISVHQAARLAVEFGVKELSISSRLLPLGDAPIGGGPRGR